MSDIERKYSSFIPKALNLQCIRCDKVLECDKHGAANAYYYPMVYRGVVFRSSGQYGSTVLDCGVGIPRGFETEVQIILCDECIKAQAQRINMWTAKRPVIIEQFDSERLSDWSDWTTFAEMQEVVKQASSEAEFRPLGQLAEMEEAQKTGDTVKVEEIRKRLETMYASLSTEIPETTEEDQKERDKYFDDKEAWEKEREEKALAENK